MSLPAIELISFNTCPFVQRSVITLLEKGIDFKTTVIDLADKPDWFLAISPLGKVPVLRIGDEVLFESAVINEFLDEITPPSLHPTAPLEKARHRAWIEFGSDVLMNCFRMMMSSEAEEHKTNKDKLYSQLKQLEAQVQGPFFSGEHFSLVDSSYAPLFMRMSLLEKLGMNSMLADFPKIQGWVKHLLAKPSVKNSVPDNFEELTVERLKNSDSYLANQLFS